MNKQDDPLASLWQSQPVQTIEPEELKAMWHKNRTRQWWWFASDIISMLVAFVVCIWLILTEDNLFLKIWGGMFIVFALVVTPIVIKLRYKSLGGSVPTSEYFERLKVQKHNNILLVRLSAWTVIGISVLYAIWSNAYYFYYEPSAGVQFYKILRASGVIMLMTTAMAIWGKYEIKKNTRELERFSEFTQ